jgi:hypothetical protein
MLVVFFKPRYRTIFFSRLKNNQRASSLMEDLLAAAKRQHYQDSDAENRSSTTTTPITQEVLEDANKAQWGDVRTCNTYSC